MMGEKGKREKRREDAGMLLACCLLLLVALVLPYGKSGGSVLSSKVVTPQREMPPI